jgi:O-methyltransferase involved in polyketide biosynthesis
MYLQDAAIEATLSTVAGFARGSELALTFRQPRDDAASQLAARVSSAGEPWVSFFTPHEIEAKLRRLGFTEVDLLTPGKAAALYFTPLRNDLPAPKRTSILSASI